jgi:HEPN domain-containing protein
MKPDPMALMLLHMAEKDFITLRKMAEDLEFADEIFGFHAQQAVEKAAKAMLAAHGIIFERTHDLETLFTSLEESKIISAGEFYSLLDLTDFAVQYRYQAFEEIGAEIDRNAVVKEVRCFLDYADNKITDICKI